MIFVKVFKGLEDKISQIEGATNEWIKRSAVRVLDVKVVLAHEPGARAASGDLVFVVTYEADQPIA
jgi:hypothetical protein